MSRRAHIALRTATLASLAVLTAPASALAHGLGLSTRLQHLGLPEEGLVERIVLFNVGVEIGQVSALAAMVGIGTLIARRLPNPRELRRYTFGALTASGLLAAATLFPAAL
jgi:hypothetical protein